MHKSSHRTQPKGQSARKSSLSPGKAEASSDVSESDRQLFTIVYNVEIPKLSELNELDGTPTPPSIYEEKSIVLMSWPDGTPCFEMDMYLMRLLSSLKPNSVRQEAVKLSHLVRYCWRIRKNFWELNTASFKKMLQNLAAEVGTDGEAKRQPNQVNEISDSCIRFYFWLQDFILTHRKIVGLESEPHRIELCEKVTLVNTRKIRSLHFAYNLPPNVRKSKKAMPQDAINRLWELITKRLERLNKQLERVHLSENRRLLLEVRVLQGERQLLMMEILQAIPVRPSEVCEMSSDDNLKLVDKKQLLLVTKKRGDNSSRIVKVPFKLTMKTGIYIKIHRTQLLDKLRSLGVSPNPNGALFLNEKGCPILVASFTREFERLCRAAKIDYRTCMSMFRHRAITTLVALHLKDYLAGANNEKVQALILSDYSVVLARVAAVSGHKNPQSLRAYIDLAWDELGSFDSIDAATTVVNLIQTMLPEFRYKIKSASTATKPADRLRQFDEIAEWLTVWQNEVKEALEAYRNYQVSPERINDFLP